MLDLRHGEIVQTVPTVEVRGIIARGSTGELCFFASVDADGVPLLDGIDGLMSAALAAPVREVTREVVEALDKDYS